MVTKIIIPPRFSKQSTRETLRFFRPRSIVIDVNQMIAIENQDEEDHCLQSVNLNGKPDRFFKTGEIKGGRSVVVKFEHYRRMIPFQCTRHPSERGVVFMISNKRISDSIARWIPKTEE